jgi:hypothetical protein
MKLTTTTIVTVDGVMQGLGGPGRGPQGRIPARRMGHAVQRQRDHGVPERGLWARRGFLFGRRTYEIFAGSWGAWNDPGDSPI